MNQDERTSAIPNPTPQTVPTASLRPNPHNPRLLFDKVPLQALEHSIKRVGILVPITVYRAAGSDKFTILDGQRRWMCAQNLHIDSVPIADAFAELIEAASHLPSAFMLSYPSDGLLENSTNTIIEMLSQNFGCVLPPIQIDHQHSTLGGSKGAQKHAVTENIFIALGGKARSRSRVLFQPRLNTRH